jgi:hypothetical protein
MSDLIFRCNCGRKPITITSEQLPLRCSCGAVATTCDSDLLASKTSTSARHVPKLRPCTSRGASTRQQECESCAGQIKIKVFACNKHTECTIGKQLPGIACCASCVDCSTDKRDATSAEAVTRSTIVRSDEPGRRRPTHVRLVRGDFIGSGFHRSGWPHAMQAIKPMVVGDRSPITDQQTAILLDDFVEQTFCYQPPTTVYRQPWVGIFHHPPTYPPYSDRRQRPEVYLELPAFRESEQLLRLAITLSEHSAIALRKRLTCPVVSIKHPTALDVRRWKFDVQRSRISCATGSASAHRQLVQLGWYLRNTQAIFQTPVPSGWSKMRIWPDREKLPWVYDWDGQVTRAYRDRPRFGNVEHAPLLSTQEYDDLLASSVVLTELIDASANNVVIECLAHATPIVVNRHPAVVEYLGADYPLYFDAIEDVADLLDDAKIIAAHEHLLTRDKTQLDAHQFASSLRKSIGQHG